MIKKTDLDNISSSQEITIKQPDIETIRKPSTDINGN